MNKEEKEKGIPKAEPHLEIYNDRSSLIHGKDSEETFYEGKPSGETLKRIDKIRSQLKEGFLHNLIEKCKESYEPTKLSEEHVDLVGNLVSSVTSEYGRAVVGLTILQLCIKAIEPSQNIRLHKAGRGDFSWIEGVPMRSLDAEIIAPVLRSTNLLKYNKFGVMMTRSLAENYPYTKFYKAAIRGPKETWLELVDILEKKKIDPVEALKETIYLLINRSEEFKQLVADTTSLMGKLLNRGLAKKEIIKLVEAHVYNSGHPARLFEIAMHSLFQVLANQDALGGCLRPLSQMRSANKKFGNVGDIEVLASSQAGSDIIEAWDAKYGKSYLFDELGELEDKLPNHKNLRRVGFVTDSKVQTSEEIEQRKAEIAEMFGLSVDILTFDDWVEEQFTRSKANPDQTARDWFVAYVETICLKRLDLAPIDEPAESWVRGMKKILEKL